ncbi:MAG TPA: hypothetical protein VLM38_11125 [Blastocatellia bacterium]|nr:hypothetical protein [Blastocatellia bacterium]
MAEISSGGRPSTLQLITVPALITLAITVLRLVGERQGWSRLWFNPDAGGGLAPIGIVWLVPIFGFYFAMKLANSGEAPASAGRVAMFALLGIVVTVIGFVGAFAVSTPGMPLAQLFVGIASILAAVIQRKAWPALFKTLLAYGLAARIPVTIIMFFAIKGHWGTHYDGPPPGFPADITWFPKFILIGVIPQLFFWVAFTVVFGSLFGAIAVAMANRSKHRSAAAQA